LKLTTDLMHYYQYYMEQLHQQCRPGNYNIIVRDSYSLGSIVRETVIEMIGQLT